MYSKLNLCSHIWLEGGGEIVQIIIFSKAMGMLREGGQQGLEEEHSVAQDVYSAQTAPLACGMSSV